MISVMTSVISPKYAGSNKRVKTKLLTTRIPIADPNSKIDQNVARKA
jgi:hypothetical protein